MTYLHVSLDITKKAYKYEEIDLINITLEKYLKEFHLP